MQAKSTLTGLVLLAALALLAGCESDPVAPNDPLPELTVEETANQTGLVAMVIGEAAGKIINPGTLNFDKALREYFAIGEGFGGSVHIEYLAAEGEDDPTGAITPETAGWAHLYTEEEDPGTGVGGPVTYDTPADGHTEFELDLTAVLVQEPVRSAVINGSGAMTSGEYVVPFTLTDFEVVEGTDYPLGTVTVISGSHSVLVGFDGDQTASLMVDGILYVVDLSDGSVERILPS